MIIIINFLSSRGRHHRNIFLCCATLRFERGHLIKFYFPPTYFFREKLFLQKGSILGNKDLAFRSEVEGIPNSFFRVSYEDALFRFGFELFWQKPFDISVASPNFKKR